jgi:hypothetical protein
VIAFGADVFGVGLGAGPFVTQRQAMDSAAIGPKQALWLRLKLPV